MGLAHGSPMQAVVHASIGQSRGSAENLKTAQQYFQLVGGFWGWIWAWAWVWVWVLGSGSWVRGRARDSWPFLESFGGGCGAMLA